MPAYAFGTSGFVGVSSGFSFGASFVEMGSLGIFGSVAVAAEPIDGMTCVAL